MWLYGWFEYQPEGDRQHARLLRDSFYSMAVNGERKHGHGVRFKG